MAVSYAYTEATTSATFNPTDTMSEYIVAGTFKGTVALQFSIPDADAWNDLIVITREASRAGAETHALHTPDALVDYRVVATGISGTANIYFGP